MSENCKHYYKDLSNHWFHWNTGKVMCIGECIYCGIRKNILFSIIKNQKRKRGKIING